MNNHEGSSAAMEAEGTSVLYHRSVEELGVYYNPRIADGDSKSHDRILQEKPYGPDHPVQKEECVGHVQKRCGTNLINLTKRLRGMTYLSYSVSPNHKIIMAITFLRIYHT